jgi:hypothetical protein
MVTCDKHCVIVTCNYQVVFVMEHESNCDSYSGKWKTFLLMCLAVILLCQKHKSDSDSDSSVDIQAQQCVEVKTLGLPHSTKHLSRD